MMRSGIFCPPSPLKPAVLVPCFGGRRVRHDGAHTSVAGGDTPWRVNIYVSKTIHNQSSFRRLLYTAGNKPFSCS